MFSVIVDARTSRAPRNTPGNASTLLIWFGKSERPVATTRACLRATSGRISGVGLDRANTIESRAMDATAASDSVEPDRPMKTSAPASASSVEPVNPPRLVSLASASL